MPSPRGLATAHRWVEHTGELEVELEAPSEEGVFDAGFEAMRELLSDGEAPEPPPDAEASQPRPDGEAPQPLEVEVDLRGRDRAALLADWLGELAFLGETFGLVPDRVLALELEPDGLRATVRGWEGHPPHLVKGATYHRLCFERGRGRWRARVVLDV
jgi:SHS2 domain-containing protein